MIEFSRQHNLQFNHEKSREHVTKYQISLYLNKAALSSSSLLCVQQQIQLSDSLVLSTFNFCDVVYVSFLFHRDQKRIQKVQKSCLSFIFGIKMGLPISHKFKDAGWLNMKDRR